MPNGPLPLGLNGPMLPLQNRPRSNEGPNGLGHTPTPPHVVTSLANNVTELQHLEPKTEPGNPYLGPNGPENNNGLLNTLPGIPQPRFNIPPPGGMPGLPFPSGIPPLPAGISSEGLGPNPNLNTNSNPNFPPLPNGLPPMSVHDGNPNFANSNRLLPIEQSETLSGGISVSSAPLTVTTVGSAQALEPSNNLELINTSNHGSHPALQSQSSVHSLPPANSIVTTQDGGSQNAGNSHQNNPNQGGASELDLDHNQNRQMNGNFAQPSNPRDNQGNACAPTGLSSKSSSAPDTAGKRRKNMNQSSGYESASATSSEYSPPNEKKARMVSANCKLERSFLNGDSY